MTEDHSGEVFGRDGLHGVLVQELPEESDAPVRLKLDDGTVVECRRSLLNRRPDGAYDFPIGPDDLHDEPRTGSDRYGSDRNETVIPVMAEELDIGKRAVPTGGVRVHRRVLEHQEEIDIPLVRQHVEVRRIVMDREVEGPLPVREEGDLTIIPIVEEVLEVHRRFRLKEEVHIRKTVTRDRHVETVTLRRQEASIEQVNAEGQATPIPPAAEERPTDRRRFRKSILGERN